MLQTAIKMIKQAGFDGYDLSLEDKDFLQNLNFYVTQEGHLYANEGYFKGIIEASKIIGNGENNEWIFKLLNKETTYLAAGCTCFPDEEEFECIDDLQSRGKVGKSVIELLKKFGCLEGMTQSNQMTLFM